MKYRKLTSEELNELEKEFIDFLVVNGITADDWVKLKEENVNKAELIIDSFSDVVFESAMRKIKYLKFVTPKSIKCFQCLDQEIVLVAVDADKGTDVDFTMDNWKNDLLNSSVYTTTKKYNKVREIELFDMVQLGAEVSKGEMFKQLCMIIQYNFIRAINNRSLEQ